MDVLLQQTPKLLQSFTKKKIEEKVLSHMV